MFTVIDIAKFWSQVDVRHNSECWEWKGAKRGDPVRGKYYGNYKQMASSRYVAMLKEGREIASDELACHHCDNPPCCNPKHIYIGTSLQNAQDSVRRRLNANVRKTHCSRGHAYAGDNLFIRKNGYRECRMCMAISRQKNSRRPRGGKANG